MSSESISLSKKEATSFGTVRLTGSKSECNRALILNALSKGIVQVENVSSADDTVTLDTILKDLRNSGSQTKNPATQIVDIGPAGTAMRFLTAFLSVTGQEVIITGTERMKQRPIGLLVDALRDLGAEITYTEKDGFPPLKFSKNFSQKKRQVQLKGNVSSQYITALLLVAPTLPLGLELEIIGELTSKPYVEMTLAMLTETGIGYSWKGSVIDIPQQPFKTSTLTVEPDWSAASYWYSIAALSDTAEIDLPFLKQNSLQGDSAIARIMESFGIRSEFYDKGVKISKHPKEITETFFDFKDCPDLAQTVVVCCAALGHNASFTGLETLKIKETDRVKALQNELAKIGVRFTENNQTYHLDCSGLHFPDTVTIATYEDHRMAMAFAPLALKISKVIIEDPKVVGKSYPAFWNHLESVGFVIKS
ncbi:3-phosphoshikimate 1-carboxyvinyltransferase [Rubrolithibacter danxiaensis]|uniref:3-phosphoshikimate 1-carboxyvinyltransferase n=1 Tax=Rubrolithibacter danxiaensis TaxID=3390805 RepID=UPI003BF7C937